MLILPAILCVPGNVITIVMYAATDRDPAPPPPPQPQPQPQPQPHPTASASASTTASTSAPNAAAVDAATQAVFVNNRREALKSFWLYLKKPALLDHKERWKQKF